MRTNTYAFAFAVTFATSALACGDSEEPRATTVDPSAELATLKGPTGTFSEASAKGAFASYRARAKEREAVGSSVSGSSPLGARSLRPLGGGAGAISINCPRGGAISVGFDPVPNFPTASQTEFTSCSYVEGSSITGRVVTISSETSLLGLTIPRAPGDRADTDLERSTLAIFNGTVSRGSETTPVSSSFYVQAGYGFLKADAPDGHLVISVRDDVAGRSAVVISKFGTWQCGEDGGALGAGIGWKCTDEKGQTVSFEEPEPPKEK